MVRYSRATSAIVASRSSSMHSPRRLASTLSLATWEHAQAKPALLNLAIGQPALSLLPGECMQRAADSLSSRFDYRHLLQYGSMAGSAHYLGAVAKFVNANSNGSTATVKAESLFATPGNSGGLSLVARALASPGDTVLMEDPSYFLAHQIFRDNHLELLPLPQHCPTKGSGRTLDLDHLEEILSHGEQPAPKLLYLVPTGNNPTGRTMADDERSRLVTLCAAHGVCIVADDVYEQLQWKLADAPRPLRCHAKEQGVGSTVVSLGSWSKVLGPGLRMGWVEADPEQLQAFAADGEVVSGSFTSPLTESLIAAMVESGDAQRHVSRLRAQLETRASLLAEAINGEQDHSAGPVVHASPAGYFLWVSLRGLDAAELKAKCEAEYDVSFLPGPRCTLNGGEGFSASTYGRACFAFLEVHDLVEAGRRLGRAIAQHST